MIAQGEHIHIAVYPGAFALHTGPRLQEADKEGLFWGMPQREPTQSRPAPSSCARCGRHAEDDVPDDFPDKGRMNTDWAHGGSSIIAPFAVPLVGPDYGSHIIYADCQAAMIKAKKRPSTPLATDARPDVLRLLVRRNDAGRLPARALPPPRDRLRHAGSLARIATKSIYPRWKNSPRRCSRGLITALSCHAIGRPRKAARGRE